MSITQRLMLTFSLLSAALIAMVITSVVVVSNFQARFQYVQENTLPSVLDIGKMIDGSNTLIIWLYRHQNTADASGQARIEKEIDTVLNRITTLNQYYLQNETSNEEDRQISESIGTVIQTVQARLPAFLESSRTHDSATALAALRDDNGVGGAARQLIALYQKQLGVNEAVGKTLRQENDRSYNQTLWGLIGTSAAVIIILGFFTLKTIFAIRNQLNSMRQTLETASERLDLTLRADDSRNDEIGQTAKAYNALAANVASSLAAVESSAQSVSSASGQISAGNEDLSSRTEEQAASLEQTAASMSELSETVRQTAENTQLASQLAKNARDISEDSQSRVNTMLSTMSSIRDSSSKITDIIAMIEGIAFQTNILALNAAVEAARAGEQGRGFAVVAGEVRTLAQRSSSSAREIKELIENSMQFVEAGSSQAEGVGQNIGKMTEAVRQVTDIVDEISVAAQEQAQGINQVHLAVNQMDDVTQQNAALVEQASAASQSLMEQAASLNQLVGAFTIAANSHAKSAARQAAAPVTPIKTLRPVPAAAAVSDNDWQSF
ncbi:methyl-accepting chemotaxis protein [Cronobacter universalis]|uniref:Methyl-accepting chemotaxis protein n=1 Tax=Cronobacter universalis NCTC 9529 TaxID=1074000 RepID=A0AAC8VTX2_9ENTR|nr:methyl-accepting chemotaxis protein [Cronobacter universalis]ALB57040.1 methyl-accepting chemotaxis protein [Cronobacter universalis NCTC 9529]MDI7659403.1 methyl-accepting chemotaxis protein [Cronobacter universalis]CCK17494.1 Methyl-accepting chemotaxis protein I (serine chemoreceptor protein) [Cronobacter universalis NCTC 9529]STE84825.1 Serine chemoreceptor protein [Cronobacter universalis NCTC 9529]